MAKLAEITKDVQHIAEAIASVIGVDVTIVDNHLYRVAGTGQYFTSTWEQVDSSSVFQRVIEKGKGYMVRDPATDHLCRECGVRNKCKEFGEVCTPINVNNKTIGVIGLIAFNEEQRARLFSNPENLMAFLERMADLIAAKLLEKEKTNHLLMLTKQMEAVFESLDVGIIAIDEKGYILQYNHALQETMDLKIFKIGAKMQEILPAFELINQEVSSGKVIKNHEYVISHNGKKIRIIATVNPVMIEGKMTGTIFIIKKVEQALRDVNDVIGYNFNNTSFNTIIGGSNALNDVKEKALKASLSSSTVLIQGESGTGKELFARAIHSFSPRKDKPFVAINCAAIPEQLLESELFGYEQGAFSGAARGGKAGKFELAHEGTLFLDEIGDMPLHLQSKLLRVLQERKVDRVGGREPIPIDVRIIAATNKDLEEKVSLGEFREDLYFRLNVIPLFIPPLRERKEDIPILMDFLLEKCNQKLGKKIKGFEKEVVELLGNYQWKGNVRELENTIEYAVNMETKEWISINNLPQKFRKVKVNTEENKGSTIQKIEEMAIREALANAKSREEAAKSLGISRATLFRKIKAYGIK